MDTNMQKSTRQLLEKIPTVQRLYRHKLNCTYYGIKKVSGKRKERRWQITDRKIAERKLAGWIKSLGKLDSAAETMTLPQLLDKFVAGRLGKSEFGTGIFGRKNGKKDLCFISLPVIPLLGVVAKRACASAAEYAGLRIGLKCYRQ
jgi:hypothetical protein